MEQRFDIVIAGAGLAGVLAAVRLVSSHPNRKILLVDKDELPGGRLRTTSATQRRWSYGFDFISSNLFEFWNQTLKASPEGAELLDFGIERQTRFGVLAANEVNDLPIEQMFGPKGARALGGAASARDWTLVDELLKESEKENKREQSVAAVWSGKRQSPSAVVLEHFAAAFGIADVWNSTLGALVDRARLYSSRLHAGAWEDAMMASLQRYVDQGQVVLQHSCRIVGAEYTGETGWQLSTERGAVTGDKLLIAQSPWEAVMWLPKALWPTQLLNMASKTKPVSVLVLSDSLKTKEPIPDLMIVPAEGVQIVVGRQQEICFQATLDYEMSLQAPSVVKAVRRLKRARKKLQTALPGIVTEGDHLGLVSVGWAQSPLHSDRRWIEKLEKGQIHASHLAFCGDAYGPSYNGDENVIHSLLGACEKFDSVQ